MSVQDFADVLRQTSVCTKIVLLLAPGTDRDPGKLVAALKSETAHLRAVLGPACEVKAGTAINEQGDAKQFLSGEAQAEGRLLEGYLIEAPWAATVWVAGHAGQIDRLAEAISGLTQRLGALVDPRRSALIAGTEETYIPGDGADVAYRVFWRAKHVDGEEAQEFWRMQHTKISMLIPNFHAYRQFHPAYRATKQIAAQAGIGQTDVDGIVVMPMNTLRWLKETGDWERVGECYEDERHFMDTDRSPLACFRFVD